MLTRHARLYGAMFAVLLLGGASRCSASVSVGTPPTTSTAQALDQSTSTVTLRQALARPSSSSHQKKQLRSSPSRAGMGSPVYRWTDVYRCRRRVEKRVCLSHWGPSSYSTDYGWGAPARGSCGCRT